MHKSIDEVPCEEIWNSILLEDPEAEEFGFLDAEWKKEYINEVVNACRNPQNAHKHIGHWPIFWDSKDRVVDCCDWSLVILDAIGVDGFRYGDMVESIGVIDHQKLVLLNVRHVDLYEALMEIKR